MAMNVSITLNLQDQFSSKIQGVINHLNQLKAAAQSVQQAFSANSLAGGFASMNRQVQSLQAGLRQLQNQITATNRSLQAPAGGAFGQQQLGAMRQMLQMQQQMIANQNRLNQAQARGNGGGNAGNGWLGRNGFSPNASLIDRAQYRGVNMAERSLTEGALGFDRARTALTLKNLDSDMAERKAGAYAREYKELSKANILDTMGEILTQFGTDAQGMQMVPHLLKLQRASMIGGETREQARKGMLEIVRGVGLTGRLTDNEGNFDEAKTSAILNAYTRAKMIGGADVNSSQFFQAIKYAKTSAQALNDDALLEMFIAMPDLRGSTYGNQLNMLIRQVTGSATKEAKAAQFKAGLLSSGGIVAAHEDGPNKFKGGPTVDQELLRENPNEWVKKYVMEGYLRDKLGYKLTGENAITPAQIAKELRPLFSNASAENIVNMIINQRQEWQNQIKRATELRIDDASFMSGLSKQSLHMQLEIFKAQSENLFGTIAENFKGVLLPPMHAFSYAMQKISAWIDPKSGNDGMRNAIMAGGTLAAMGVLRGAIGGNPLARALIGGGMGLGVGGIEYGIMGALMGSMFGRGGGSVGTAAAGGIIGRMLPALLGGALRMSLWGLGVGAVTAIVSGWDSKKGVFDNIGGGLMTFLNNIVDGVRKIFQTPEAKAAEDHHGAPTPITPESMSDMWDQNFMLKGKEKFGPPVPTDLDRLKDWWKNDVDILGGLGRGIRGVGRFMHDQIFSGANASELPRGLPGQTDVPGTFLGTMPQGLGTQGPSVDLGSQIKSAAEEAAAQIRGAGGTLAGAITAVAGQVSSAGNAISAAAATVGAAAKGTLGNQSRSTLGDGVKT